MTIRNAGEVRGNPNNEATLRSDLAYNQGTVQTISTNRNGLDVLSNMYVQLVAASQVDSYSNGVITRAAHVALSGDVIQFTSGILNQQSFTVYTTATNTITLGQTPNASPAANDTFDILRFAYPRISAAGLSSVVQSGTWTMQPGNTANTTPWLVTVNQGGNSATVTASNALKVDGSAVTQPVGGVVAAGIAVSGNPVYLGAQARSGDIAAVGSGQAVGIIADTIGRTIVYPFQTQDRTTGGNQANIASSGNITIMGAGGVGVRYFITSIDWTNDSATPNTALLTDGAGGATQWQKRMIANSHGTFTPAWPLRFSANTAVVLNLSAASSVYISLYGFAANV